jgi:endonuclease/exonuclease/phosphatase family metal-dependent hydrolase
LARQRAADVLVLAEGQIRTFDLLYALNTGGAASYRVVPLQSRFLRVFTNLPARVARAVGESDRSSYIKIDPLIGRGFLLAAVHLRSKLYDSDAQLIAARLLAHEIQDFEQEAGDNRTLLVGDLNMNPFEDGIVGVDGLNATMSETVASKSHRTFGNRDYPFFYNPMWRMMGDPAVAQGSYYFDKGHAITYYWNTFDQVLMRPALAPFFDHQSLQFCVNAGGQSLLRNGRIDSSISDHLPLLFRLNLEQEEATK